MTTGWGDDEFGVHPTLTPQQVAALLAEARLISQARRAHAIGRLVRDLVFLVVVVAVGCVLAFVVLAP